MLLATPQRLETDSMVKRPYKVRDDNVGLREERSDEGGVAVAGVSVRYIVDDVEEAIEFYALLGFDVGMHPGPGFASLVRKDLRLLLNVPEGGGGAGRALADGSIPAPGGWNRFQIEVEDIEAAVERLASLGVHFRSEIITGRGGKQAVANDPSGNPVELFQAAQR